MENKYKYAHHFKIFFYFLVLKSSDLPERKIYCMSTDIATHKNVC